MHPWPLRPNYPLCKFPILLAAGLAALLWTQGCSRHATPPGAETADHAASGAQTLPQAVPPGNGSRGSAAGVSWSASPSWELAPERPMRVATYRIPAVSADEQDAECAVFFFGGSQGGSVEANIQRWQGQFANEEGSPAFGESHRATREIHGLAVTTIDIYGTYLFSPTPMSPQKIPKPGYRMLGAIIEAPGGNVFFKLTGPEATVAASAPGFESLLQSLERS
ncbi:MAG: hypothetical protein V3U98_01525 [Acidobacteriota bacterium]